LIPQLSAVIWDMDGVIVDSGDIHFEAWQIILSSHQVPFSRETFDATFGMNNRDILKTLLTDRFTTTLFQTISVEKENLYRKLIPGRIELLTGVHTLLEQLHSAKIQQAVGSSAPMENIDAILDSLHLRPFFKTTISAYNIPGKPNPAVFLKAAEELNVSPYNCIVIEDSTSGVEAAKRAGMKCVAVLTTHPAEKLQNADLVVNDLGSVSPENLVTIIKGG